MFLSYWTRQDNHWIECLFRSKGNNLKATFNSNVDNLSRPTQVCPQRTKWFICCFVSDMLQSCFNRIKSFFKKCLTVILKKCLTVIKCCAHEWWKPLDINKQHIKQNGAIAWQCSMTSKFVTSHHKVAISHLFHHNASSFCLQKLAIFYWNRIGGGGGTFLQFPSCIPR